MSKSDAPALRLKVENLRLAPASPYDQERIASYRNGSEVYAVIKQPKNEKLNRKFHAVLARVISDCDTPWKTVDEAKDSLKVALGVTRQVSTIGGDIRRYPGSLADLDDPEFVDFYEGAMAILHKMTGVDPETLGKESADTGDEEQNSLPDRLQPGMEEAATEAAAAEDGGESADGPPSFTSSDSASGPPPPTAEQPEPSSFPSPLDGSGDINRAWLAEVFRVLLAAVGEDPGVVDNQAKGVDASGQNQATLKKATAIKESLKRGCGNDPKRLEAEIDYCAGLIGVDRKTLIAQAEAGGN